MTIGRRPDADVFLDDVTVSRDHALLVRRGGDYYLDDLGSLNGTYVNRAPDRVAPAGRRRRAADRQVQADLPLSAEWTHPTADHRDSRSRRPVEPADGPSAAAAQKSMTIGAVCKALAQEFPDISISKIRYLEDQKLLSPRRTQGGYRLYTPTDVARLRTILRLQRDEFLPLRVIRQELAVRPRDRGRRRRAPGAPADARSACAAPSVVGRGERRRAVLARRRARGDARAEPSWSRSSRSSASSRARSRGGDDATTTRPSARSSAPSPSSRATASAGATCASSAPPPTARPRCCSRSSPRRCARATPSAARRRSRRSRTSPRSPRTSSTCC